MNRGRRDGGGIWGPWSVLALQEDRNFSRTVGPVVLLVDVVNVRLKGAPRLPGWGNR